MIPGFQMYLSMPHTHGEMADGDMKLSLRLFFFNI